MPGLVVNMLVVPGDSVSAGQTVVILEAMKMENDLPAPIDGTIKEVRVQKGDTVDNGQILVTIEP
jgi:biotin carboxyl carrier protein